MKRKYFKGIRTLDDLRTAYKKLLRQYHPDNGGSEEICKEINVEYEQVFQEIESGAFFTDYEDAETHETKYSADVDRKVREMINKVVILDGLEIEISGCWIWLSGNTYQHKEAIKAYGFKWSTSHKKWYYKPYESRKPRRAMKEEDRRAKYGSRTFSSRPAAALGTM